MKTNIIVITGGVYSSLGKGIIASSIGCILKNANYNISMLKLDPYLNAYPGKLSPYQHGEVFVTTDGCETDLDLGHYERFTQVNQTKYSTTTSGKIYHEILNDEINNKYDGKTIQVVPHVTNKIIEKIEQAIKNKNPDFLIIEIGGTIGDIESLPYIEALRIYNLKSSHKILFIHASPLLQLETNNEIKTKPTQHSIKMLRNLGINPYILILRNKNLIDLDEKEKLSWTCDIKMENIFVSTECSNLYDVPKVLFDQKIEKAIFKYFDIKNKKVNMLAWNNFLDKVHATKQEKIKVAIYGNYSKLADAYLSLIESLKITAYQNNIDIDINLLDNVKQNSEVIKKYDGVIIYGDVTNKVDELALDLYKICCKHDIKYLGIGLGLKVILDNLFVNEKKKDFLIKNDEPRLGSKPIDIINNNSIAFDLYKKNIANERHRDYFYFDDKYTNFLESKLIISATSWEKGKKYFEIIEDNNFKFNIGILFHPEYEVKPYYGHILFDKFIKVILS